MTSNDRDGRTIQAEALEQQFPKVKERLYEGELLLGVAERKPPFFTGLFCVLIGIFFIVQITAYFLLPYPQWAIPLLAVFAALTWAGVRLAVIVKNEYVFVTDRRIVHEKVNFTGRPVSTPVSIPISEIKGVQAYRGIILFLALNHINCDIIIKKRDGKTYLVPTLIDGVDFAEILLNEVRLYRGSVQ